MSECVCVCVSFFPTELRGPPDSGLEYNLSVSSEALLAVIPAA